MSSEMIIANGISKTYRLYQKPSDRLKQFFLGGRKKYFREVEALKPLSLLIGRGETLAIVGRNGSGKSTLLQMLCGTLTPTTGALAVQGRLAALLELGAGFNPEFTGHENIYLNGTILGLSRAEIDALYDRIVAFSGIEAFIHQPVKTYSSGMVVRLAFSIATAWEPDVLIVDEALAVGDEGFQRKCYARIRELQDRGTTILFVSHSAQAVIDICARAILLEDGEMLMDDTPKRVIAAYQRLLFAPPAQQPQLREQIKRGELASPVSASQESMSRPPESRMEYTPQGGRIESPVLTTLDGRAAHFLTCGEEYLYRFSVTFERDFSRVWFGMLMKTPTGFELAGARGNGGRERLSVRAGETVKVVFRFRCPFIAGTYYVNCGCTYDAAEEEIYIHRIIDAVQFRAMPHNNASRVGVEINGIVESAILCSLEN